MRILKAFVLGTVSLLLLAVIAIYVQSARIMNRKVTITDPPPTVVADSSLVAQGTYLVRAITKCGDCHGEDLGGNLFIDGGPLGKFYAPNLTKGNGGVGNRLSDADLVTVVRHAARPDGTRLLWMPPWVALADSDAFALVAYIRSLAPVDREMPASTIGPLGRALLALGQLPLYEADQVQHSAVARPRPPRGATAEYGAYLAKIGGCEGCHGPTLSGGRIPGTPPEFKPAANITPAGIGRWTEADFFRALREGKRPDGSAIDSLMPVKATKQMTDDDTRALWLHLKAVPSKPYGGR